MNPRTVRMNGDVDADDRRYLRAAIRLARRHEGLTRDNPSVGCLLVRDRRILGRGVTALGGRPHAEVVALREAGPFAVGATAYVSLEPCAHHGRSPPCADALIDANVARVVIGLRDPFPDVDGRGIERLRAAGVAVTLARNPDLTADARDGMAGFLSRTERRRPYVVLKLAVSAEAWLGRKGEEVAITGSIAQRYTHLLRARADGIVVGIGTVLADDPSLTCRLPGMMARSPARYVLDRKFRTPSSANLVRTSWAVPSTIVGAEHADGECATRLRARGVRVTVPTTEQEYEQPLELGGLRYLLDHALADGNSLLLVEGGASVARSFLAGNLVDEIHLIRGRAIRDDPSTAEPIASPLAANEVPSDFEVVRAMELGEDQLTVLRKIVM